MQGVNDGPLAITQLLDGAGEADQLRELLRDVQDPELGVDIVSLGLIYHVSVAERVASVRATTTTPACPLGDFISGEIERVLLDSGAVDQVDVEISYDPPWTPRMMSEATRRAFGWS
jgi:metal-sulfur cluster biosynthetic enzyme